MSIQSIISNIAGRSEMLQKHGAYFSNNTNLTGHNHYINEYISIHAECHLISRTIQHYQLLGMSSRDIRRKFKKTKLCIGHVKDSGKFGNSMPCSDCIETIKAAGISKVSVIMPDGTIQCKKDRYIG